MAEANLETRIVSDEAELVQRAILKDEAAVRSIIKTHNRRLYRVARSIVKDDGEAEDVLQEAYFRAFSALGEFREESRLATWLTRIVINEALQRQRRRIEHPAAAADASQLTQAEVIPFPMSGYRPLDPERTMAQREIYQLLERAIDKLPDDFRIVLVARAIEGMSIEETADQLGLRPETVKTRLHRARRLLKAELADHIGPLFSDVFPFDGKRCERVADAVVKRLNLTG